MKKLIYIILSSFVIACSSEPKINPVDEPGNKAAIEIIKNESNPVDVLLTEANVLYVSVSDDGTIRNGLAESFCQILKENKASCNWVKVIKAGTTSEQNGYGIVLGESKCD